MLERLSIRGLGLISEADIDFDGGLVVVTGETGAGKTLLLDAISAIAGKKPGMAALNSDTAIDATIGLRSEALDMAQEVGAASDDSSVILSRLFPLTGKAKSVVDGRPVPASWLSELSSTWLAVHGQHDSLRLLKPGIQRQLLDRHGGEALALAAENCRTAWFRVVALEKELESAKAERTELLAEAEAIRADVQLCDSLVIDLESDSEISNQIERLARTEQIRQACEQSLLALTEDNGAMSAISMAAKELEHSIESDPVVNDLVNRLRHAGTELGEVAREISGLAAGLEQDPAALDTLMLRQRQLKTLLLRHGPNLQDLVQWLETARRRLELADPDGHAIAELANEVKTARAELAELASRLTDLRVVAGEHLSAEVTSELQELAMPYARFSVSVTPKSMSEHGVDQVDFMFSANPGLPLTPVAQAASGGELSRLMLALEVTLSADAPTTGPSTMIFDEVDAGVAGAAAIAVGQRLAKLARYRQVLVVSHLAQIAAFADQQILVEKDSDGMVTSTTISPVGPDSRILEIARMLAGLEESQAAQIHAQELLGLAGKIKGEI